MKKLILLFLLFAMPFAAGAQIKIAYFSYDDVLRSMPEYASAQKNIDDLRAKYDSETKRAEDEFNNKYEEFLDGEKDFAPSILQKRQAELQYLMEKNMAFKKEAQRLIEQAQEQAFKPIKDKLNATIKLIGQKYAYSVILNTDNNSCPYINPAIGEDISTIIKDALR
jgi:outer membrane protein